MTCCNSNPYGWDSNRSFFFVEITGVFECCYRNSNETSKTKNLKNGTEKSEKFQFEPLCLIWIGQKTLNHWAFSLWPWSCLISIKYGNNPLKESWFPLHRRLIRVMVMRAFFIVERHKRSTAVLHSRSEWYFALYSSSLFRFEKKDSMTALSWGVWGMENDCVIFRFWVVAHIIEKAKIGVSSFSMIMYIYPQKRL